MKEINKILSGLILIMCFSGTSFPAPYQGTGPRTSVSFSTGLFRPKEESFRKLYGSFKFQTELSLRYRLWQGTSLYSGLRYFSTRGTTAISGPEFQDEKYALKFTMYSILLGLNYSWSLKSLSPYIGSGISYNIYREAWDQTSISFEGKNLGFFLVAGIEYFIGKKFSLLGGAKYSHIPTQKGSKLVEKVNLGGLALSLGLSFYF